MDSPTVSQKLKMLAELFFVFFKIGAVTFGGGMAMLPILERELVDKRKWTTASDLLDYYAIGQATPGIIAVNVATFIGFKYAGFAGAIIATAGIVVPSLIVIMVVASLLENIAEIPLVKKALTGINAAVAALLTHTIIKFSKKSVTSIFGVILFLASFAAIFFFKVNSGFIVLFGAGCGIVASAIKRKNAEDEKR